jgi:hypothetical protein
MTVMTAFSASDYRSRKFVGGFQGKAFITVNFVVVQGSKKEKGKTQRQAVAGRVYTIAYRQGVLCTV